MQTGIPPTVVSHTIDVSPSRRSFQRSSGSASVSDTERITERMSKGCLRSGLSSWENTSPTVLNGLPTSSACSDDRTSRSMASPVGRRRGNRSPGTT